MKLLKIIFVPLILSLGFMCYNSHSSTDFYGHLKYVTEATDDDGSLKNFLEEDHQSEEVDYFVVSENPIHDINADGSRLYTYIDACPNRLAYPVWLPPKVS